jgi:hypothetical protein
LSFCATGIKDSTGIIHEGSRWSSCRLSSVRGLSPPFIRHVALPDHKEHLSNAMTVSQDAFPACRDLPSAMQLAFLRAIGLVSVAVIAPAGMTHAGRVQLHGLTIPSNATADRASVVQIFHESYHAYRCGRDIQGIVPRPEFDVCPRKYAFGHDEVAPLSRQPYNPRNGWGATIVDAMSTMVCRSRYFLDVFGLNHDLSTSWDLLYDNRYSSFPLTESPCLMCVLNLGLLQCSTRLHAEH